MWECMYVYKMLKKSMENYFCLEFLYIFLHHIHMGFTCSKRLFISLHFAKKTHENRSGESRMLGSKSKVAET